MKDIFDLYEDGGICATPANTMGMGNPMPAGVSADGIGSEPLVGKTAKAKKEKSKKEIKDRKLSDANESILDDIDATIDAGSDLVKFIDWYVGQYEIQYGIKLIVKKLKKPY